MRGLGVFHSRTGEKMFKTHRQLIEAVQQDAVLPELQESRGFRFGYPKALGNHTIQAMEDGWEWAEKYGFKDLDEAKDDIQKAIELWAGELLENAQELGKAAKSKKLGVNRGLDSRLTKGVMENSGDVAFFVGALSWVLMEIKNKG
jgi:hypothetical protein